jgi:hypothetical protein
MYFIVKTFGHKSYWFCYDLMKIIMDLVILFLSLLWVFTRFLHEQILLYGSKTLGYKQYDMICAKYIGKFIKV